VKKNDRLSMNKVGRILKNILSATEIETLTTLADAIYEQKLAAGHAPQQSLFYLNFIPDHAAFANLVDDARVLPKVWGILGWNIYLYHAHLIMTPPSGQLRPPQGEESTFGWPQDSGRVNVEIECHPRLRLSFKVAYFLSDSSEEGRGNF
jgi:ectoine hydroxylase